MSFLGFPCKTAFAKDGSVVEAQTAMKNLMKHLCIYLTSSSNANL